VKGVVTPNIANLSPRKRPGAQYTGGQMGPRANMNENGEENL